MEYMTPYMIFFVTPKELGHWIVDILQEPGMWGLIWTIRPSTYSHIVEANDTTLIAYERGEVNKGIQFFIGDQRLSRPVMQSSRNGNSRIDFKSSLCIQLVPSFFSGNILLGGSFDALSPKQYGNSREEKEFLLWRRAVGRSFKKKLSNPSIVATQKLDTGSTKVWRNIVVSSGALEWFRGGGKLKQFAEGLVEFVLEEI